MPISYAAKLAIEGASKRVAIIDIGSNSVRLVVYHGTKRIPLPLFNEKYMCALGKGLAKTGHLNPKGVTLAHEVIARSILMARRMEVESLDILATAAVRDALDGPQFVKDIERTHKVHVEVLSGERESILAAQGILTSMHEPEGISADLGGGSMEVAELKRTKVGRAASMQLGSLRLYEESDGKLAAMEKIIAKRFAEVEWLEHVGAKVLFAIGGGFRSLAKLHMKKTGYPLGIVHEYQISRRSVMQAADRLLAMKVEDVAMLPGISAKRAPLMAPTAMLLRELMLYADIPQVMFSVSGIREGYFYHMLSPGVQAEDGLIASANDLAALVGLTGEYARELFVWMQPLFRDEPKQWRRLREAACILSEIAWSIDPIFRSGWAYHRIIQSSLKGMDHKERLMLALALYHRYQFKWKGTRPELGLLDERERLWAKVAGSAANLAFDLTGGKAGTLHHAKLSVREGVVVLAIDAEAAPLYTDIVQKRLEGLGEAYKSSASFI